MILCEMARLLLIDSRRADDHVLAQIAVCIICHEGGRLLRVRHVVLGAPLALGGWSGVFAVHVAVPLAFSSDNFCHCLS
ncbi:hypothetical protein N657DRAFT_50049 [Parathielavia appendiculata]|uniref:Uncharacterized protein n=1 Tax=Parathielavia appendiculata TaxID=2587402 RepID=A0AAN6U9N3_9PEZI|nr:hypothetical protein N657DRAFT_50049 [Parathielavia appendiculata]